MVGLYHFFKYILHVLLRYNFFLNILDGFLKILWKILTFKTFEYFN